MKEKFADFESVGYLGKEGTFVFEVKSYELSESKSGNTMAIFDVENKREGCTRLYFTLSPKARWNYNNFIKACLASELDTDEKISNFEWDYETDGRSLIGKKFKGVVVCEQYMKEVKKPLDDGTFETCEEVRDSYKIKEYLPC